MEQLEKDLAELKDGKCDQDVFQEGMDELKAIIAGLGSGKPVEIKQSKPSGPSVSQAMIDKWNKAADRTVALDEIVGLHGEQLGKHGTDIAAHDAKLDDLSDKV